MNRKDIVAHETHAAALYRREAKARRKRYPAIAEQLDKWAAASESRAATVRFGPLFRGAE